MAPDVSICYAVKNRSLFVHEGQVRRLLPESIRSLGTATLGLAVEVFIADAGSRDWPPKVWAPEVAAGFPVTVFSAAGPFNRGRCHNESARRSAAKVLCFLDADMWTCPGLFARGLEIARSGRAFFPLYQRFRDAGETAWKWGNGTGNCLIGRDLFDRAGGWPESDWRESSRGPGTCDTDFLNAIRRVGEVVREPVSGFCHLWHPKKLGWDAA